MRKRKNHSKVFLLLKKNFTSKEFSLSCVKKNVEGRRKVYAWTLHDKTTITRVWDILVYCFLIFIISGFFLKGKDWWREKEKERGREAETFCLFLLKDARTKNWLKKFFFLFLNCRQGTTSALFLFFFFFILPP